MAPLETTVMVLKVDLQCDSCYKKVKKVLCKFPQIRNNVFDEKANTVLITVICCSPEKIRDKIYCKGGKAIKSIEIKDSSKEPEKSKPAEKTKEPEKPNKPKSDDKPTKPVEKPPTSKPVIPIPEPGIIKIPDHVHGYPPRVYPPTFPVPVCCGECYHGYGGGPCHNGFGRPVPPPPGPCYNGYEYGYEYGYGYGYGGNRACHVNRCDYSSEENTSGCSIM